MRQAEVVMQSGNWMHELFEELKRRRVIRVATLYIIAFWPIIQIVDILSPTLNLPDSVIRYLVFAFIGTNSQPFGSHRLVSHKGPLAMLDREGGSLGLCSQRPERILILYAR